MFVRKLSIWREFLVDLNDSAQLTTGAMVMHFHMLKQSAKPGMILFLILSRVILTNGNNEASHKEREHFASILTRVTGLSSI